MATQDRDTLKSYFETGDRPTAAEFQDLIDSAVNLTDDGISIDDSDNITIAGGLTVSNISGDPVTISSSTGAVNISGDTITISSSSNNVVINGNLLVNGYIDIAGHGHVNRISTHSSGDAFFHMHDSSGTVLDEAGMRFVSRDGHDGTTETGDATDELHGGELHILHEHEIYSHSFGGSYPDTFSSADYAEYFESEDGKPIPAGTAVAIGADGKIHPAKKRETPIGIISPDPLIAGNNPAEWPGKYLRDKLGQIIMEPCEEDEPETSAEQTNGKKEPSPIAGSGKKRTKQRPKINPEYDPDKKYIPRKDREEWCCVGLLGQLPLYKNQPVGPGWIKLREISAEADIWLVK